MLTDITFGGLAFFKLNTFIHVKHLSLFFTFITCHLRQAKSGSLSQTLISKSSPLNFTNSLLNVVLLSVGYRHVCPFTAQSQVSCHCHLLMATWSSQALTKQFHCSYSKYYCKSSTPTMPVSSLTPLSLFHQMYLSCLCFKGLSGPCNHYSLRAYDTGFDCFSMKFLNKPLSILSRFGEEANTVTKSLPGGMSRLQRTQVTDTIKQIATYTWLKA